ncbi:hypothetical protein [Reichenbachiella versicolor]|uniref:hypothetical protein n=1 Tax=Reichenbachiella versicolor TaxID=1821036 RepID=UPI000D6E4F93|nr:hypothetical protein [Reichenbachiella versicolor]
MNNFEKYLKENKNELKRELEPRRELWDKIDQKLENKRNAKFKWIQLSAAVVALLLAATALFRTVERDPKVILELPLAKYSTEYGLVEQEYQESIRYSTQLVANMKTSVEVKKQTASYLNGLEALEMAYEGYKKIVVEEGCDDIMMELIIDNYQRRLELLENLQGEIKKLNNHEKMESTGEIII